MASKSGDPSLRRPDVITRFKVPNDPDVIEPALIEQFGEEAKLVGFIVAEWSRIESGLARWLAVRINVHPRLVDVLVNGEKRSRSSRLLAIERAIALSVYEGQEAKTLVEALFSEARRLLSVRNGYTRAHYGTEEATSGLTNVNIGAIDPEPRFVTVEQLRVDFDAMKALSHQIGVIYAAEVGFRPKGAAKVPRHPLQLSMPPWKRESLRQSQVYVRVESVFQPSLCEPLAGAGAKIDWAFKHVQDLERLVRTFNQECHDLVGTKEDSEAGQRLHYLRSDPKIPVDFALIAGNVLQSLRSALDHVAHALCLHGPGFANLSEREIREIAFPISRGDANRYRGHPGRNQILAAAKPEALKAVDEVEPYIGGAGEWLIQLSELNNIDKHRLLFTVVLQPPSTDHIPVVINAAKDLTPENRAFLRSIRGLTNMFDFAPVSKNPLKAGDVVFRESIDARADEKMSFAFPIALNETQILPMKPLIETLQEMANLVRNLVPKFDPLF